jgi:hypothetical protein
MSYYEEQFDTEWESLDRDEAMMRAFALGVAASLGERNVSEYNAIHAEMETNYDASIVELAYEEGKAEGKEAQRGTTLDDERVWLSVLSAELDIELLDLDEEIEIDHINIDEDELTRPTDFPSAVSERSGAIDKPDLDPEQTDYPDFLE